MYVYLRPVNFFWKGSLSEQAQPIEFESTITISQLLEYAQEQALNTPAIVLSRDKLGQQVITQQGTLNELNIKPDDTIYVHPKQVQGENQPFKKQQSPQHQYYESDSQQRQQEYELPQQQQMQFQPYQGLQPPQQYHFQQQQQFQPQPQNQVEPTPHKQFQQQQPEPKLSANLFNPFYPNMQQQQQQQLPNQFPQPNFDQRAPLIQLYQQPQQPQQYQQPQQPQYQQGNQFMQQAMSAIEDLKQNPPRNQQVLPQQNMFINHNNYSIPSNTIMDSLLIYPNFSLFVDPKGEYIVYKFHKPYIVSGTLRITNSRPMSNLQMDYYIEKNNVQIAEINETGFVVKWRNNTYSSIRINQCG